MTIDAEKLAQAIIDDATAAGFTLKPGHQRSTAKSALAKMLDVMAAAWIDEHMTRQNGIEE